MPTDKYVSDFSISDGTISIGYGNSANGLIANRTLSLRPSTLTDDSVIWTCGYAADRGSDPATGAAGANLTSVGTQYLPSACRSSR